jgi:putative hydrolase of the HAD superfamily
MGPIVQAQQELNKFMEEFMPLTHIAVQEELRPLMQRLAQEQPLMAHDLTSVRRAALRHLAEMHSPSEMEHCDAAIDLFLAERSRVGAHLYSDVLGCFETLRDRHGIKQLAIVTNGNARVTEFCTAISQHLSLCLTTCETGCLKPSPLPFVAVAQRLGVSPNRVLFVGDSLEKDALAACAVGMLGCHLSRETVAEGAVVSNTLRGPDRFPFVETSSLKNESFIDAVRAYLHD